MAVLVKDVMIKNPVTLNANKTIGDAVEIFAHRGVGSLPLVNESGELVGFLSDGDIIDYVVRNVRRRNNQLNHIRSWYQIDCFGQYLKEVVTHPVYNCSTQNVITVDENDTIKDASRLIQKKHLKHVPVIADGKLVGLLTRNDIVQGLFSDYIKNPDAVCVEEGQEDDF
jgi:CBS domain-containing protein